MKRQSVHNVQAAVDVINANDRPMRIPEMLSDLSAKFKTRSARPVNVIARDIAESILDDPDTPLIRLSPGMYTTAELEFKRYKKTGKVRPGLTIRKGRRSRHRHKVRG